MGVMCCPLLSCVEGNPPEPPEFPPLTQEQRDEREKDFVSSIDGEAVCALASRYNCQKPCRIVKSARGGFNVCFFVDFDTPGMTWVVRIPIEPAIHDAWSKLQSEVVTMRYIQNKTKIPVPHIHAYGRSQLSKNDSTMQAFLIIDCIPGRSFDIKTLLEGTDECRNHFYSDLIDIFVQLRKLEFPASGSLMPDPEGGPEPVVGNLLSTTTNELQLQGRRAPQLAVTSATQFAEQQYQLLSESYRTIVEELWRQTAEQELFALDSLAKQMPEVVDSSRDGGPFVLTHTDLRCANIIVDDDFHIRGIIDWEWASTVPRQFFTPPTWITGHDREALCGVWQDLYPDFRSVLETKSRASRDYDQLLGDWDFPQKLTLPVAHIFSHPSSLVLVFYKFIYPELFRESREKVVPEFFSNDENEALALEAQRRIDRSERYTQYLKDNGLFVVDEYSQKLSEWLARGRELCQKLDWCKPE
ncbi:hypothetical protein CDD83_6525 [Cordyceps sp. RAO-2017]|nr:hypothetical protein CDD83_6525 [Cordyceps sp. RAO-2017]